MVSLVNLNNTQKHIFHIFNTLADISFNYLLFQMPAEKLLKMSAHCANAGTIDRIYQRFFSF